MAGDYIPWVKGLSKRREVLLMAAILGVDRRLVACSCMELWEWADSEGVFDESRNCHVTGVTRNALNALCDTPKFIDAMISVGWLTGDTVETHWIFPRLGRWVGSSAKERLSNAERQRRYRAKRNEGRDIRVTCNGDKVTARREEKSIKNPLPLFTIEELVALWNITPGVRKVREINEERKRLFRTRWKEEAFREGYGLALKKFPLRCFADVEAWQPDLDWFLRKGKVIKILEGTYDWTKPGAAPTKKEPKLKQIPIPPRPRPLLPPESADNGSGGTSLPPPVDPRQANPDGSDTT